MNNPFFIISFIIIVFVVGGLFYIYNPEPVEFSNPEEKNQVVCTMEARLCPDGSYVGRVPPNCEFKDCPPAASTTPQLQ